MWILVLQLVELKNGETYNGHLVNCDNWMNIQLKEVICTSRVSAYTCTCMYVRLLCMYMYICMYVCMYVCIACIYNYNYINTVTNNYIYICSSTSTCWCIY